MLCCNTNTTLLFCLGVFLFDLTCLISLGSSKNIYSACESTNLPMYLTMYLITPYMFFEKHKVIKAIKKCIMGDFDSTVQIEKIPSSMQICFEWVSFLILFVWGIFEFKVRCTHDIMSTGLYWTSFIVMVVSGIATISQTIMLCCGATMSIIKQDPNDEIHIGLMQDNDYSETI